MALSATITIHAQTLHCMPIQFCTLTMDFRNKNSQWPKDYRSIRIPVNYWAFLYLKIVVITEVLRIQPL